MADTAIIESSNSGLQQQQAVHSAPGNHSAMNQIIPIITAEIQMEQQSSVVIPRPSSEDSFVNNNPDEPEAKRKKTENSAAGGGASSSTSEKLELRLGGILCCAVCLDLPKTAMYQVSVVHFVVVHCPH